MIDSTMSVMRSEQEKIMFSVRLDFWGIQHQLICHEHAVNPIFYTQPGPQLAQCPWLPACHRPPGLAFSRRSDPS